MDLIERQAAIAEFSYCELTPDGGIDANYAIDFLTQLPSAQPERKNGKWIAKPDPYEFFDEIPVCSECGCTTKTRERTRYCPFCGADMRGDNNG